MVKNRIIVSIWTMTAILLCVYSDTWAGFALLIITACTLSLCILTVGISGRRMTYRIEIEDRETDCPIIRFIPESESPFPVFASSAEFRICNVTTGEVISTTAIGGGIFAFESDLCGCVNITAERINIFDFLHVFRRTLRAEAFEALNKTYYIPPRINIFDIDSDQLDSYDFESYEFSAVKRGDDPSEVFDLKEYGEGDKIKSVHWKLSSKLDDLIIKEHSFPMDNKTILIFNNSMESPSLTAEESAGLTSRQRSELIEFFFSLSASLTDKDIKHTLGWYDYPLSSFKTANIESLNDLWDVIPGVMSAGYELDPVTAAYHYLEHAEGSHFSNYVYVTPNDMRDIERLEEYGEVKVFTPTEYE